MSVEFGFGSTVIGKMSTKGVLKRDLLNSQYTLAKEVIRSDSKMISYLIHTRAGMLAIFRTNQSREKTKISWRML